MLEAALVAVLVVVLVVASVVALVAVLAAELVVVSEQVFDKNGYMSFDCRTRSACLHSGKNNVSADMNFVAWE